MCFLKFYFCDFIVGFDQLLLFFVVVLISTLRPFGECLNRLKPHYELCEDFSFPLCKRRCECNFSFVYFWYYFWHLWMNVIWVFKKILKFGQLTSFISTLGLPSSNFKILFSLTLKIQHPTHTHTHSIVPLKAHNEKLKCSIWVFIQLFSVGICRTTKDHHNCKLKSWLDFLYKGSAIFYFWLCSIFQVCWPLCVVLFYLL